MQVETQGGADSKESSASNEEKVVNKSIDPRDHDRAVNDMMKYKKELSSVQRELEELREAKRSQEADELKKKGLDKELAEKLQQELNKEREENKKLKTTIFSNQKYQTILGAAKAAGLLQEAESDLEMLDLDDLSTELTTKGRVLVHGVDEYVEKIKKTKPHWFKGNSTVKFNSGGTGNDQTTTEDMPLKDIMALKYKDKKKYDEELQKYLKRTKK